MNRSTGILRRRHVIGCTSLALALWASTPATAQNAEAVLYRIFLADGKTLVSYGEYARVGDRVVFSLPLGVDASEAQIQLVSIPATTVDWGSTERYAESARYARYAATRAESDFTLMSSEVARALNEIALASDPARRVQIAEDARRTLLGWTRANYGYRADDVRQIVTLLDEAISEIRAAAGAQRFDLNFVAMTERPHRMLLLPKPTLQEIIEQALTAARVTDVPAERLSLLRSAIGLLDGAAASLPPSWVDTTRAIADSEIEAELRVERAYANLAQSMVTRAVVRAARADVRGVEDIVRTVLEQDEELGRRRPNQVAAVLVAVEAKLDAARRLRLARDRWTLRVGAYRKYRRALNTPIGQFNRSTAMLDDIRILGGPSAEELSALEQRIERAARALDDVAPPAELQAVHTLLARALQLAASAVHRRRQAVAAGDLQTAWDAASAAAGSMMLFTRARADLEGFLRIPVLR